MVHSRCSATVAVVIDHAATRPDSAAGNATGLFVSVARTSVDDPIATAASVVIADDRSRRDAAGPDASCCRDAGRPVAGSNHDSAVAAAKRPAGPDRDVFDLQAPDGSDRSSDLDSVVVAPNVGDPELAAGRVAAVVPNAGDPGSVVVDVAVPSAVAAPELAADRVAAVVPNAGDPGSVVVDVAVPSAVAAPGSAVDRAAAAVAPNAAVAPDSVAIAADVVLPNAAAVALVDGCPFPDSDCCPAPDSGSSRHDHDRVDLERSRSQPQTTWLKTD